MKIAVCDDEPLFRKEIVELCNLYEGKTNHNSFEITEYSNGKEFLDIAKEEEIDIVFLDIDMPVMDGISVKEEFGRMAKQPIIIFISAYQELMQKAFGISVCGFLIKPVEKEYFYQILEKAIMLCSMNCNVSVGDKENPAYISSKDILYIKSDKVYSNIITFNETYLVRKSLNQWENELDYYGFFRIHKSYFVNMQNIEKINNVVVMKNKEKLKISRSIKRQFLDAYNIYCKIMAKYV